MTINERLFKLLDEKAIKQADLAAYLNIRTSVIGNWKTRGTTPPAELLIHICEYLNISIYELLGVEDKHTNRIENIYKKLSPDDKATVDFIFSKYENTERLSISKIG